jgi:hypothetical protein
MTDGVNSVSQNPAERAIAQIPAMVQGVQMAAQSGKIEAGLRRVSLQSWKDAYIKKGVPRIQGGATQAQPKVQAFMQQLLPFIDSAKQQLQGMPRGSPAQNDARLMFWVNQMRQFRRT